MPTVTMPVSGSNGFEQAIDPEPKLLINMPCCLTKYSEISFHNTFSKYLVIPPCVHQGFKHLTRKPRLRQILVTVGLWCQTQHWGDLLVPQIWSHLNMYFVPPPPPIHCVCGSNVYLTFVFY